MLVPSLPSDTLLVLHKSLPPVSEGTVRTVTFFKGALSFVASLLLPLAMVAAFVTNLCMEKYWKCSNIQIIQQCCFVPTQRKEERALFRVENSVIEYLSFSFQRMFYSFYFLLATFSLSRLSWRAWWTTLTLHWRGGVLS